MDKHTIAMIGAILLIALSLCEASTKKGYGIAYKDFVCDDLAVLGVQDVSWWYDWHLNPFYYSDKNKPNCTNLDELSIYDQNHYSMKWGKFKSDKTYELKDYATVLLGFNEPNHYKQARMFPQLAAEQWPQIEALATSNGRNLPIASPAAAPCTSPDPKECLMNTFEWFDQFYGNCTELYGEAGCRVDYTATHWYGCTKEWLFSLLKKLYNNYGHPVWLTEFACPSLNQQEVLDFMADILPRLENKAHVEKYAWFVSRIKEPGYVGPTASLLKPDSSELTELGQIYVNFQAATTK